MKQRQEPTSQSPVRVGVVGLDSSHALQFSRRMFEQHSRGRTLCRVTSCWDADASPHADDSLQEFSIRRADSLEELFDTVDAVMVLTVDGNRHFDLAMSTLAQGLPLFIDKPLTCSAAQAASLLQYSGTRGARCYSASALRFIDFVPAVSNDLLGRIASIDVSGSFQETATMRGLWYYGCHSFELLDSLWQCEGPIERVRARLEETGHRIDLLYRDGRTAVIGLDCAGVAPFGARLKGEKATTSFQADLTKSYDRLVESICGFFEGGEPPVRLERTVETIAAIECAHRSLTLAGAWISIDGSVDFPSPDASPGSKKVDFTCI